MLIFSHNYIRHYLLLRSLLCNNFSVTYFARRRRKEGFDRAYCKIRLDWIGLDCKIWTGFASAGLVWVVNRRFVKHGFVKRTLAKHGFVKLDCNTVFSFTVNGLRLN